MLPGCTGEQFTPASLITVWGIILALSSGLQCYFELRMELKKIRNVRRRDATGGRNEMLFLPSWSWINKIQDVHIKITFVLSVIRHFWKQNL